LNLAGVPQDPREEADMNSESAESALEDNPFDLQDMDRVLANRAECEQVERRHSEEGTLTTWLDRLAS
jgi:hypothetical protein